MSRTQYSALVGFGFAVTWITLGFGDAVLCLVAAGVFAGAAAVASGDLDLAELQDRLAPGDRDPFPAPGSSHGRRVR